MHPTYGYNNSGSALTDSNRIFNDSEEMVDLLVSLGADINTAKTLMCLHVHGLPNPANYNQNATYDNQTFQFRLTN